MDPLKDYLIAKICGVSIECYDIDSEAVDSGNLLMQRIFGSNPPVKYVSGDFLDQGVVNSSFSLALLSQMDYVLSNSYLKSFSMKLSLSGVGKILIASPSSFRWRTRNPSIFGYNVEKFIKTIKKIISSSNTNDLDSMPWHIRTVGEIVSIFSGEYTIGKSSFYRQPYAVTNLLAFDKKCM